MKAYYGENFWGNGKPGTEMEEIRLDKEFVWEDVSGFIPSLYVCAEGIAIDFCIRISNQTVQDFWNQWQAKPEGALSEEERVQIAHANPLTADFTVSVFVNGIPLENDFSCGAAYTKAFQNNMEGSLEEQLFLAYGCDEKDSWYFKRHMCRWSDPVSEIKTVTIDFCAESKSVECGAIEIGMTDAGKEFELTHPLSGAGYKLCVEAVKQQELAEDVIKGLPSHHRGAAVEYPRHYLTLSYYLQPNLPEDAFILQSAGKGEQPRAQALMSMRTAVSVIGWAGGPASVFIAGKRDKEQGRISITSMYFEPIERELWKPVFLVKERGDMRFVIALK